jgi:non-ribosomal peptide synthetase component E (peptide arylation enzyme)
VAGHPDVDLVAVVGMPDPVLGERVCAFIKPKPDQVVTFADIIAFLKAKNTSVLYLPERIEVVAEIPLTPVGKIDKKKLREDIRVKIEAETAANFR